MSNLPVFGVYYDMSTQIVTKKVFIDISPTDSGDNIKRGLRMHQQPNEGLVFVAQHQANQLPTILAGLGISLTA